MKRVRMGVCIGAVLLGYAASCSAQGVAPPSVVHSGELRSVVSDPGLQLSATSESSSIALKFSQTPLSTIPAASGTEGWATWSVKSFTAEAPLKKGDQRKSIFTHEGWTDSTSLGFNFTLFATRWNPGNREAWNAYCKPVRDQYFERRRGSLKADATQEEIDQLRREADDSACEAKDVPPEALAAKPGPRPGGLVMGGTGEVAFQKSVYFDGQTLQKNEERHHPWSISAFVGLNPASMDKLLLIAKAKHKREFELADATIRCPLATNNVPVTCVEGSFGAPTHGKSSSYSLEARYRWSGLAAAAIVARNTNTDITTFELPVYAISNGKLGLTGGVRILWASAGKEKGWGAGLFVGVPFNFYQF